MINGGALVVAAAAKRGAYWCAGLFLLTAAGGIWTADSSMFPLTVGLLAIGLLWLAGLFWCIRTYYQFEGKIYHYAVPVVAGAYCATLTVFYLF